jgi:signal transduction histidine kinase
MNGQRIKLFEFASLMAGTGLLLGIFLAAVFTRPLARAGQMASQIAGGDFSVRLASQGPRELSKLADHFNEMAEKLESQARERSQVLASITHELGRPLGALKLGVDSLRNGALQDAELTRDMLEDMSRTLQQIEAHVQDFAVAARPQEAPLLLHLESLDVKKFLHSLFSRFLPMAENRSIEFKLDLAQNLPLVMADESRLNQVMGNLVDNALKFTPALGQVTLSAHRDGPWVSLGVLDSGPGIPRDELTELFKPFSRGSNARHSLQGMGLGLSIVQRLVEAHGGRVLIENVPGHGLFARVLLLPAAPLSEEEQILPGGHPSAEPDRA